MHVLEGLRKQERKGNGKLRRNENYKEFTLSLGLGLGLGLGLEAAQQVMKCKKPANAKS